MEGEEIKFQFVNECRLESYFSPFGSSGIYIKISGTDIMGVGTTVGPISGTSQAFIYYNDKNDLLDKKYRLYAVVDEEGMIRIDFVRIFTLNNEDSLSKAQQLENPQDRTENSAQDTSSSNWQDTQKNLHNLALQEDTTFDRSIPALILRAKCPDGHPDVIEPFIGIFSFEREE